MSAWQKTFKPSVPMVLLFCGATLIAILICTAFLNSVRLQHRIVQDYHCINNLRQIDAAANQFALEHQLTNGAPIHFPDDLTPYIKLTSAGKIRACPQGGIYSITKVGASPTCSLGTTIVPAHVLP